VCDLPFYEKGSSRIRKKRLESVFSLATSNNCDFHTRCSC
jgi:hypothetical protein